MNIDGSVSFDNSAVAEKFNNFFTNVASSLVDKLPTPLGLFGKDHINSFYQSKGIAHDCFELSSVTVANVCKMLSTLDKSKATGLDNIPARFVSDAAEQITPSIAHIINNSITQGKVPQEWKVAKVTPLYKKGNKTDSGNYRPVSVLSIISKVMERIIYDQMYVYLETNNILYDLQSGFRKSYSTETCLSYLTDHLKAEIDQRNFCGMLLIDLQKAFDTVNHNILLYKLTAMGFKSNVLNWMSSYLSVREQSVNVNGVLSRSQTITCGVPQGSILGPLLFLLYVNDMQAAVKCKLLLYADDSALLVSGKDISSIESKLSNELSSISNWLVDNKLSLHLGKTESILFGSRAKLNKTQTNMNIQCNGTVINSKTSVKYLGAEIDQHVSGENMALKVIQKVSSRTKFLARKSKYLDQTTMKLLASAIAHCHIDYACTSWYSSLTKKTKTKLQTCQNRLIKTVLQLPHRTHLDHSHFESLNWLPVEKRVNQLKLGLIHKTLNGLAPKYMSDHFIKTNTSHNINTRSSHASILIPRVNSIVGKSSLRYTGATEWNKLPASIQNSASHNTFKKSLKSFLINSVLEEENNMYVYS